MRHAAAQRMGGLQAITHVIFDLDGTLIDSESVNAEVNNRILARYGKQFSNDLHKLVMGQNRRGTIETIIDKMGLTDKVSYDEFNNAFDALWRELLPNCRLMPGAMRFVRHLSAKNIPMAICTGSIAAEGEMKLSNFKELAECIPLQVFASDPEIKRCKPAPDSFIVTASRFKEKPKSPGNVLVFEDSINGVRAAIAAGMHVAMVPDARYVHVPENLKKEIDYIFTSFEKLEPQLVGLPPYS